jgi:hypothetical protein
VTPAEVIGFLIFRLRSIGADAAELAHDVELLVRAAQMDRETIREARDTLALLGYGPDLSKLLTHLARRARPKRRFTFPNHRFT